MTSKIKVDNIENQCGGAVVTKCGGTTTISGTVVKSNAIQASDGGNLVSQSGTTITLGASGDTINLASGASQSGFGRTGTVDWQTTPKTATFTAVSGEGYFANTSGGAFNMNLPAGVAGAIVSVADYGATFQTNNLTVVPNGTDKIGSTNENATLNVKGQSVTFVFVDSTQGWINTMDSTSNVRGASFITATGGTITTSGNDKIHTFTGPGTFTVNSIGSVPTNEISYMIIAGGGGGGQNDGGGGGAGGFREVKSPVTPYTASPKCGYGTPGNRITVSAQGYPIVVGGGGGAAPSGPTPGISGGVSSGFGITSAGGGGGGSESGTRNGLTGGSGGGGSAGGGNEGSGGAGNDPSVTPPQGNPGGGAAVGPSPSSQRNGGGAGGATATGQVGQANSRGGSGGAGATTNISASPVGRAGGGGGGGRQGGGPASDGGGAGSDTNVQSTAGTVNTGGGGGGSGEGASSNAGGSGIVIIRYRFQ